MVPNVVPEAMVGRSRLGRRLSRKVHRCNLDARVSTHPDRNCDCLVEELSRFAGRNQCFLVYGRRLLSYAENSDGATVLRNGVRNDDLASE